MAPTQSIAERYPKRKRTEITYYEEDSDDTDGTNGTDMEESDEDDMAASAKKVSIRSS